MATAPKRFSYVADQTPVLNAVYPSVSYGGKGTKLAWYMVPRIKNLGADKDQGTIKINSRRYLWNLHWQPKSLL
jgi:hypothetical protein